MYEEYMIWWQKYWEMHNPNLQITYLFNGQAWKLAVWTQWHYVGITGTTTHGKTISLFEVCEGVAILFFLRENDFFETWHNSVSVPQLKSNMILYCFLIGKFPEVEMVKEQFLHTSANNSSLVLGSGDDATPSLHCFANNKRHAKGSAVAHIVVLRPEKDATSPHSLVFIPPRPSATFLFPINFHRHRSQSCQSLCGCSLPHSPPVKLPGGFPVTGWQGGAAVGPACLCEMFIWSGELTGLTAHPHRAFVMWFKPPCGLSQAPLYSPIQMKAWDWLSFFGHFACNCRNKEGPHPRPSRRQTFLTGLGD